MSSYMFTSELYSNEIMLFTVCSVIVCITHTFQVQTCCSQALIVCCNICNADMTEEFSVNLAFNLKYYSSDLYKYFCILYTCICHFLTSDVTVMVQCMAVLHIHISSKQYALY
jgi:hypothetical protein